eukprot:4625711-Pyramimonas_sp.AAC.1
MAQTTLCGDHWGDTGEPSPATNLERTWELAVAFWGHKWGRSETVPFSAPFGPLRSPRGLV